MNTTEKWGCPFKKLNNRIQKQTKDRILKTIKQEQAIKHKEYVYILRVSFQKNKDYYTNIHNHITKEDLEQFRSIDDHDARIQFINTKMKEYFWRGIIFDNQDDLAIRELSLKKIGNLWLDDVTSLLDAMVSKEHTSLYEVLLNLDKEINLRLKNNVLIDSIIHLKDFPDVLITKDREKSAKSVWSILEGNFIEQKNRFSPHIIPEAFIEPMKADNMIDEAGVIPQLTFGCPVVNLNHGEVFRSFVKNFIQCFFSKNRRGRKLLLDIDNR